MLDSLNEREKKLAIIAAAVVPLFLFGLTFLWFLDKYDTNARAIDDLTGQIEREREKTKQGILAAQRQRYYRKASLPKRKSEARSVYKRWLADVTQKEFGLVQISSSDAGRLEHEGDLIATRDTFKLRPKATLPQLLSFLHAFYSADHLHRINSLSIKPLKKQVRGKETVLTGQLQLTLDIEVLSLTDGPRNMESFPAWTREMPSLDDYKQSILARNIFGPANNLPSIDKPRGLVFKVTQASDKESASTGSQDLPWKFVSSRQTKSVKISATDADEKDLLSFELVESSIDGAELGKQPATASVRNIVLDIPPMKPGSYPMKFLVKDSGMPPKSSELEFEIVFEEEKAKPKKPEEPPILMATETYVRGFMGGDGRWKALIHEMPTAKTHWVFEGDSITLDDRDWKATSVTRSSITFEVDGESKTFERDCKLSEPVKRL
jgi:hypothetical protein